MANALVCWQQRAPPSSLPSIGLAGGTALIPADRVFVQREYVCFEEGLNVDAARAAAAYRRQAEFTSVGSICSRLI